MLKTKGNSGFTLMELTIAVAIVAIGAGVAFFSINGMMPGMRLSEASRNLKSDLNLAKLRAVRENDTISIDLDTDGDSYTIYFDLDNDGAVSAGDTVIKSVTMDPKVDLTAAAFGTGPVAQIFFDSRGLAMASAGSAILQADGKQHDVVLAQTGRVTIQKH